MAKKIKERAFDENNEEFNALCKWIEEHLLEYPEGQHISDNYAILKLRGLETGQIIADSRKATNGVYTLKAILYTFMRYEKVILRAFDESNVDGERAKVSYACAVIRDKIYDTQLRIDKAEAKTRRFENVQISESDAASRYKAKEDTKKIRHSELW